MLHREVRHLNVLLWIFLSSLTIHTQGESPIAPGAAVERIATGYAFLEGPSADTYGNIYFTDIPTERILRWTPDDGVTTYRQNTNQANGLIFDLDGRLLICEMKTRRITALGLDGNEMNIADHFDGLRFNSPNDMWVDRNGGIYFTDPRYGATDEHGIKAIENRMHFHDLHATLLHLMGLDHEKLTYRYAGRDFRLTDVHGNVAKEILA